MEGWMSPEELNWELEFAILVTEDTSSKVHQLGSANKMVIGTREPQLAKVCHPMQESTYIHTLAHWRHNLVYTQRLCTNVDVYVLMCTSPNFVVIIFPQNEINLQCVYQD